MTVHRSLAAALLAALAAGCNSTEPTIPRENYALIYTEAHSGSGESYVTFPVASFFRSAQLTVSSSTSPADQCIETTYDPDQGGVNLGNIAFFDAGVVTAEANDVTRPLTRVVAGDAERYEITSGSGLPYVPGDTIEFTVGGASGGFPAFAIRARSAEAFTFDEPAVPAAGQPIALSWTTGVPSGSAMLVSLRYRSATAETGLDRQIYCEMVDDGSFNVGSQFTAGWRASAARETAMSRWRTEFKQVDDDTWAVVSSNFTVPTPPPRRRSRARSRRRWSPVSPPHVTLDTATGARDGRRHAHREGSARHPRGAC